MALFRHFFCHFRVLVADHVCLVDNLAAGYEAVGLVQCQGTHCTLEEVRMADVGLTPDALTPRTHMQGTSEALCLSLVKREKPVFLDAR